MVIQVSGELVATYELSPVVTNDPVFDDLRLRLEVWKKSGAESYSVKVWRLESYRFKPTVSSDREEADVQVLVVDDFLNMKLETVVAGSAADAVKSALEWLQDWFGEK